MSEANASRVLGQLGYHVDHGVGDFALTELTPIEVYGALAWALDEIAQQREDKAALIAEHNANLDLLREEMDWAMFELDRPIEYVVAAHAELEPSWL